MEKFDYTEYSVIDVFDRAGVNTRKIIKTFIPLAKCGREEEMKNRIIEYIERTHFGSEKYLIDDDVVVEMLEFLENHRLVKNRTENKNDMNMRDMNDRDTVLHAMCCLEKCANVHFCKPRCFKWHRFNEKLAEAQKIDSQY